MITDADCCAAGLCDSGYPCPLHALAARMAAALRRLCDRGEPDLDLYVEARSILRELDGP